MSRADHPLIRRLIVTVSLGRAVTLNCSQYMTILWCHSLFKIPSSHYTLHSKYLFATVIKIYHAFTFKLLSLLDWEVFQISPLLFLSPQETTTEGRKWKRVSQAGYDWNQSAQWQQHPHKAWRQQSVKKSKKKSKKRNLKRNVKRGVGRLATKRTFGSRDQNPEKLQQWKIVEWNTISVYNNAPVQGMCK